MWSILKRKRPINTKKRIKKLGTIADGTVRKAEEKFLGGDHSLVDTY